MRRTADRSRELGHNLSMGFRLPGLILILLPAQALARRELIDRYLREHAINLAGAWSQRSGIHAAQIGRA